MISEHYVDYFFMELEEHEKLQVLRDAGISDDRPDILRGRGGLTAPGREWMEPRRRLIIPLLLRIRNLSDRDIGRLVTDGDLNIGHAIHAREVRISFSLLSSSLTEHEVPPVTRSTVRLTDLAAASAMMSEMFVALGSATKGFGTEISASPPEVHVESGSVEIAVGGGLFGSGMGLIVACSAGLVAAPIVGAAAGVVLASAGIIELALAWKQKIAETAKTKEETRAIRIEHDTVVIRQSRRLRELEIRAKEIELEKARLQAQEEAEESKPPFAPSSLVPREVVIAQTERWEITEGYANHVLNRGLPTYAALQRYFADIKMNEQL